MKKVTRHVPPMRDGKPVSKSQNKTEPQIRATLQGPASQILAEKSIESLAQTFFKGGPSQS